MPENRKEPGAALSTKDRWLRCGLLGLVCALVIGIYAGSALSGLLEFAGGGASHSYYNLLVAGFRAGQLNLKTDVPPGLAQLPDPYDPAANEPYRLLTHGDQPLHDTSYYQGKVYLYFGVTPALLLFWPYAALTGQYLLHKTAVVVFFSAGFLAGAALLVSIWRRYFSGVSVWIIAFCLLGLGLGNFIPPILARCDVYEVAISCGYALVMLALLAIWQALHHPARRELWIAAASLSYGLALGARPGLLFGSVILLAPLLQGWRGKQRWPGLLLATGAPIVLVGLGLLSYNHLRFGNPFEFGQHYHLAAERQNPADEFRLRYLWFNFRLAFLDPAHWSTIFPFVQEAGVPALPRGAGDPEHPFGVLSNIPIVWLALAAPLAWRRQSAPARSVLRWFTGAVALVFATGALFIGFYYTMCLRYELEFAHALVFLAVLGVFGLEQALAGQPRWRRMARGVWGLLLAFSIAFNLLAGCEIRAVTYAYRGGMLNWKGQPDAAIAEFHKALALAPNYADALHNLGLVLYKKGDHEEAIANYRKAAAIQPRDATIHYDLGSALAGAGKLDEAIAEYRQAVENDPNDGEAYNTLGLALYRKGQLDDAIVQYRKAAEIQPRDANIHYNLGNALAGAGKLDEAIAEYRQAVENNPSYGEAYDNLGLALFRKGEIDNAIAQYRKAVALTPDNANASKNLGVALYAKGDLTNAIAEFHRELELAPNDLDAEYSLGVVEYANGDSAAAIAQYRKVLARKPDYVGAQIHLANALLKGGAAAEAMDGLEKALEANPTQFQLQTNVAWRLATLPVAELRNGKKAVSLAEQASRSDGANNPDVLRVLAAAYAEEGDFARAGETAQRALGLARAQKRDALAAALEKDILLYKSNAPLRQTPE